MRFTAEERVAAPADWAFERLADPDAIGGALRERGLDARRIEGGDGPNGDGPGAAWRLRLEFRGARREAEVSMAPRPPRAIRGRARMAGVDADAEVTFEPDGPEACTMRVAARMSASGLQGRALLATLGFARGRIDDRFGRVVEDVAIALGERRAGEAGAVRPGA